MVYWQLFKDHCRPLHKVVIISRSTKGSSKYEDVKEFQIY